MVSQVNLDVRLKAREYGIPLWALAKRLQISEPTLYRKLRDPLSPEERKRFLNGIEELRNERKH